MLGDYKGKNSFGIFQMDWDGRLDVWYKINDRRMLIFEFYFSIYFWFSKSNCPSIHPPKADNTDELKLSAQVGDRSLSRWFYAGPSVKIIRSEAPFKGLEPWKGFKIKDKPRQMLLLVTIPNLRASFTHRSLGGDGGLRSIIINYIYPSISKKNTDK
jgi:hypothetical protein